MSQIGRAQTVRQGDQLGGVGADDLLIGPRQVVVGDIVSRHVRGVQRLRGLRLSLSTGTCGMQRFPTDGAPGR